MQARRTVALLTSLGALLCTTVTSAQVRVAVVHSEQVADKLDLWEAFEVRRPSPLTVEEQGFGNAHVAVIGRLAPAGPSEAFLAQVEDMLLRGRGVVFIWDGASILFDGYAPFYRFGDSPQLGWFSGTVGAGVNLLEPSPIRLFGSNHLIYEHEDVLEEINWGGWHQFFVTLSNVDPLLELVSVFEGDGSPAFPDAEYPALLVGRACAASVAVVPLNVSDVVMDRWRVAVWLRQIILWVHREAGPVRGPCPPNPDQDDDGVDAPDDNCPDDPNPEQEDIDDDYLGDACDICPGDPANDADEDGICGDEDNCPEISNGAQTDNDRDGFGDECDACEGVDGTDSDGDGFCPDVDNCPGVANEGQEDMDGDEVGDACDPDKDGDGLDNDVEVLAELDPADRDTDDDGLADGAEPEWNVDSDSDGRINALDHDSDNDGLFDGLESGVRRPPEGTDTGRGHFQPDADPETTTDPLRADTDGGGAPDGVEDVLPNGRIDPGEGDPNDPSDDERFIETDAGTDAGVDAGPAPDADSGAPAANDTGPGAQDAEAAADVATPVDADGRPVGRDAVGGQDTRPPGALDGGTEAGGDQGDDGCSCTIGGSRGARPWLLLGAALWSRRGSQGR